VNNFSGVSITGLFEEEMVKKYYTGSLNCQQKTRFIMSVFTQIMTKFCQNNAKVFAVI
jgi:hypothetical protein